MTLTLSNSPEAPEIKTFGMMDFLGIRDAVCISGGSVSVDQFLGIVARDLVTSPSESCDHRLRFIETVRGAEIVPGYGGKGERISMEVPRFEKLNLDNPLIPVVDDIALSRYDLVCAAYYVLTNTNLYPSDPRLEFVDLVKGMSISTTNGTIEVTAPADQRAGLLKRPAPVTL